MLCRHAGVDVLSVEYRKAPEHPFPGYVEDARTAYRWAAERYATVAVGGDSAGGNLAATLAIEFDPALALLIYPVVDATQERRSRQLFGKGFFLTDELMQWYTGHFLPRTPDPSDPLHLAAAVTAAGRVGTGAGGHRRLRPAARRGRGLRRGAARGGREGAASAASPGSSTASSTPRAPVLLRATRSSKSQG